MSSQGASQKTDERSPAVALSEILNGYRLCQAVYVAAKLGIADFLKGGPKRSEELATATGVDPHALYRVLRALASLGVFAETDDGRFTLTPLGALLRTGAPGSLRSVAILDGEWRWRAYGELLYSVTTGKPGHDHVYGVGTFEYLAQHPDIAAMFFGGATSWRSEASMAVAAAYDFSGIRTLVDVGGGQGDLIVTILKVNPSMRGVFFDLPYAIDGARSLIEAEGVADRCELVAGDFFESVPSGDAYILRGILLDWDDERAVAILKNCHRAMRRQGRLLVVEGVLPPRAEQASGIFWRDLEMLVMTAGGRERTEDEYRALFASAGFKLTRVIPTSAVVPGLGGRSVIEGVHV